MNSISDNRVLQTKPQPKSATGNFPDVPGTEEVPYRQPAPKGTPQTGDPPNEKPPMKDPPPDVPSPKPSVPSPTID